MVREDDEFGNEIAVIGLAGRFPRCGGVDDFWQVLREGVEAFTHFDDDDLLDAGLPARGLANPDRVRARPILDGIDLFDADFFGYSPREAEVIDPQQRLFLECCWEAMESAGYDPERFTGAAGVFGGGGPSSYFLSNLYNNPPFMRSVGMFPAMLGNDKDFLAPRVSYKLNLRGPSINVVTGCSTSLVAVHLAVQSLLGGESDIALAGGTMISVPQRAGYLYQEGSVMSPDGHCRAFDADAEGTVPGDGVAVVLLKRLSDALDDRDHVLGVIRGSAVNNDGSAKAGFTAPSVEGQANVIAEALAVADVDPATIDYVETHGTGTRLGDAVEITALTQAFDTPLRQFCRIGTLKPNIGHTDTAAGALALIKVLLALRHEQIPPCINVRTPNPRIDFANSPFRLNTELSGWPRADRPRRAAVSSFTVGGTNAHVIVEEAPLRPARGGPERPYHLVVLSARSATALNSMSANLLDHLERNPGLDIADVAHTLQVGRRVFEHRAAFACRDVDDAVAALAGRGSRRLERGSVPPVPSGERSVAFLFPGQGSQYAGMGRELYGVDGAFRRAVDECAEVLLPVLGLDLREVLHADGDDRAAADERLAQTWLTQPALFVTEYALARQLAEWGVKPAAMLGHSVGEYVAACLAGVMTLTDALHLVAARGRLMQDRPGGAMVAVAADEERVTALVAELGLGDELCPAAVNGPDQVVVAGGAEAVATLVERLAGDGVRHTPLRGSHAFHSPVMDPVVGPLADAAAGRGLRAPRIPVVSSVTGDWLGDAEAADPAYWGRQARATVRYAAGFERLLAAGHVLLEVGPGDTLRGLAARFADPAGGVPRVVPTLPRRAGGSSSDRSDLAELHTALGALWVSGVEPDWEGLAGGAERYRVPLPTYPFERQRYWVEPVATAGGGPISPSVMAEPDGQEPARDLDVPAPHERPLSSDHVAPRTRVEEVLTEIWQDVMGIRPIGVHDGFFELGGHSLMAVQLVARLREAFPVAITSADLLAASPTVAGMAEVVEEELVEKLRSMSDDEAAELLSDQNG
ncbi:type I polyketide synthase [Saccharothrix xinjiangensis]|uniref:Type I polyketide synthase n=1 Tax=Saccharothrix xinjiangensis TaxID=204798 RepID=A0ABV9Y6H3_9PSEU